ncbi:MAG: methyltransferase domain-containing protein [Lachnospiraceae bacterium]|jgi:2-polyprenyl-3-methyl-5-hydroxy-6-metoxy-1,4-benzoquinol methylase|nr:methyltransferase domain-containing protein [Lachnospiraceae bacterium]
MRHCIACRSQLPAKPVFLLRNAPASAQNIPDEREVKEDEGLDLELYQCSHCGLVQFDCEPVSYYRDVIRAGGLSTTMKELRHCQYRHLIETYHLEGKRFLEVGCGQGEFLQMLTEFPVRAYGMEHNPDLVRKAREAGLTVWQEFAGKSNQVFGEGEHAPEGVSGPFDVFLSFNFLEHQPEPDVMLQAIWNNLTEDGMGLLTVPALEYILEQGSYYELLRDHIAYYSFGTLRQLLEQNGFLIVEEEMVNRDTISMIVKKTQKRNTILDMNQTREEFSDSLSQGYKITNREMEELAERLHGEEKTLAVWGASHQGFTLASTTVLGRAAKYIIDSAPFKQGRFAPASHLPIVAPDHFFKEPVDVILIVAPGYTDEIGGIIRQRFGVEVEILALRTSHLEGIGER